MTLGIILGYLCVVVVIGLVSASRSRRTGGDFFIASRTIGPFMLLMSLFGTTMTSFALTGSSGQTFVKGIGVYGMLASWSGIIHPLVFFLVGAKVWSLGRRHGYLTQLSFFRHRYQSELLAVLLFPLLVGFVVVYILMGAIGAGRTLQAVAGVPYPAGVGLVCSIVLVYVFCGGMRATAWANTLQTLFFMAMGVLAFVAITTDLGGPIAATRRVVENTDPEVARRATREGMDQLVFLSYAFIPVSVGMFPHLFQHWLTAKSANNFKFTVAAFPLCIMITWVPCVLIGMWATAEIPLSSDPKVVNSVLPLMVKNHSGEFLSGLIAAGILAAMMSSMDSQFLCVGTMFTSDVYLRLRSREQLSEAHVVWAGRVFVLLVVVATYFAALVMPVQIFPLGVWCFTGFASLFPLLLGAVYWRRANKYGAMASVVVVAALWIYYAGEAIHGGLSLFGVLPVVVLFSVSTLVFVLVSLLTPRMPAEHVEKFF